MHMYRYVPLCALSGQFARLRKMIFRPGIRAVAANVFFEFAGVFRVSEFIRAISGGRDFARVGGIYGTGATAWRSVPNFGVPLSADVGAWIGGELGTWLKKGCI